MVVVSYSEKSLLDLEPARESVQATSDDVPDGGFAAWLQVAAAFCIFMNTAGLLNSFGIFQGFTPGVYLRPPLDRTSPGSVHYKDISCFSSA